MNWTSSPKINIDKTLNRQPKEPQNMSSKKAILEIELGYESTQTSNTQIRKDIKKEAQIPWCSKIRNIEVHDTQ